MNYKLYQSNLIKNNHKSFIQQCWESHDMFEKIYADGDSTWDYQDYNIFSLTSSSLLFYCLFKELNFHIRSFIGNNKPLWIQCWINFHSSDKVLKKHSHHGSFHGYVSIDPKDTTTVFNNFEIKNKIGQIYIGPGGEEYSHYVKVNKPYDGKRITLGFDVADVKNQQFSNLALIPLI